MITIIAPNGNQSIVLPSGTYDVSPDGTIRIPNNELMLAFNAGWLIQSIDAATESDEATPAMDKDLPLPEGMA